MKDPNGRNAIVVLMGGLVLLALFSTSDAAVAWWGSLFADKMDALFAILGVMGLLGVLGDIVAKRKKIDIILYLALGLIAYYLFIDKH